MTTQGCANQLQHGFWYAESEWPYPNQIEYWGPYFEGEALAELGFSKEVVVS